MVRAGVMLGVLVGVAGAAAADPWVGPPDHLVDPVEVPRHAPLSLRVARNLTVLSGELNEHLRRLSFDALEMRFDVEQRHGRVKVDLGDASWLSLRVDGDVQFRRGHARVKARVDLGLAGQKISVELPEFDVMPDSVAGQRSVVVRVPVIEGTF